MSNPVDFPGDVTALNGSVVAQGLYSNQPTLTDAMISPVAAIDPTKMYHYYAPTYSQVSTVNGATERKLIHVVRGASGTILSFAVGAVTAATVDATATIDLKKNGASILTGTISLTASTAAFILLAGTLSSSTVAAGDVLEVHVTAVSAGAGALAKGLFAVLRVKETP